MLATGTLAQAAVAAPSDQSAMSVRSDQSATWSFVVSGDSRNCGDVVMPSIARATRDSGARFYWHLGDFRWIRDIDEDFAQAHPGVGLDAYRAMAWDDFVESQIAPFGDTPVMLGIGNHETVGGLTRQRYLERFGQWLDAPALHEQRLRDDPGAASPVPYYHWSIDGVDFINLDNATSEQFDAPQMQWLRSVLDHDAADKGISVIVLGMHEALPNSIASDHSMGDSRQGVESGRSVYQALLALSKQNHKSVYVLASHSHFYMGNVFDTPYWRAHGGVLPGWIIGTAGARRYELPRMLYGNREHRAHVYGYLLGTVLPAGTARRIRFQFHELTEREVPAGTLERYGAALVHECYEHNP
jgi:hypothetical protein